MEPRDGLQLLPCPMRLAPIASPVLSSRPGQRLSRRAPSRAAGVRSLVARGRSGVRTSEFDATEVRASEFNAAEVRTSEFDASASFVGGFTRRGRVCEPADTVKPNRIGKSKAEMVNFLIKRMPPLKVG